MVGAIIGSGIFLTPSSIARLTGSVPGLLFVWVLGGVLTFCGALAYAELGTRVTHGRAAFTSSSARRTGR